MMPWSFADPHGFSLPDFHLGDIGYSAFAEEMPVKLWGASWVACLQATLFPKAISAQLVISLYQYLLFFIHFLHPRRKVSSDVTGTSLSEASWDVWP